MFILDHTLGASPSDFKIIFVETHHMKNILAALLALACMYPCIVQADDTKPAAATDAKPADAKKDDAKKDDAKKDNKPVEVEGSVTIDGKVMNYIAKAGMLPILKADGKPSAQVFHTVYTLKDAPDAANRPVTFCFNGGPGSSSVWLHLGAFGPKRVDLYTLDRKPIDHALEMVPQIVARAIAAQVEALGIPCRVFAGL